jgi:NAD(P)-dependent dehydrogenase (short-subunit alcohol dehydrogenase family)
VSRAVVVLIGSGGMGEAIARRQAPGCDLVLADFDTDALDSAATRLAGDGYEVVAERVDVADRESVEALVELAAGRGEVTQLVHTAGISPGDSGIEAILRVDMYGVAVVLEAFGNVIAPNGAGVVIASMAGHLIHPLPEDQETALATMPAEQLLSLPFLAEIPDPGYAYSIAKRANRLRVMAESVRWGRRGARLNSISPGIIATPQGRRELDGEHGDGMRAMIAASGTGRAGTPADIADGAAFLLQASFVTGIDLLVDGGVVAALAYPVSD